jgi:lysophospholipase L1-like esterase
MAAILVPQGKQYYEGVDGKPLVGGKVYTYAAGTSTPKLTWADANQVAANSNPVILDARGEASIFWNGAYKVTLRDAQDNLIWTQDNVTTVDPLAAVLAAFQAQLAGVGGAALVGTADGQTAQAHFDEIAGITDIVDALQDAGTAAIGNVLPQGLMTASISTLLLGDSLSEGTGATTYDKGYSCILMRSLEAANDRGYEVPSGFGYHTVVNMANAVAEASLTLGGGGSYTNAGITGSRITLAPGGYIEMTGRQISSFDLIYNASASTGSVVFTLNGDTVATKPVSGSGYQTTFQTQLKGGYLTQAGDLIRITASGGSVEICGLLPLRQAALAPLAYVAAKAGSGYQDYTSTAALDEIAYYLNLFRAGSPKVMIHALGTNNIYSAGKALSPSAMVAQMTTLIAGINSRCTGVSHLIQIPPKANEAIFPVINPGSTYADYVNALVAFAIANRYGIVRQDLSPITTNTALLPDGVHPNDTGHLIMAAIAAATLELSVQPFSRTVGPQILRASKTFDPPSIPNNGSTLTGLVCTGAALGDFVQASFSVDPLGVNIEAWVQAPDVLNIRFVNFSGGAVDLPSATLSAMVTKR